MKGIKRLDVAKLSEKFGLEVESEYFVFKPQQASPKHHLELHRSKMYSLGLVIQGKAELKVGLETYAVQAPGLVAVGPDQVRQWILQGESLGTISLFFTEDFVISGLSDTLFLKKLSFFERNGNHFIPVTNAGFTSLRTILEQIEQKKNSDYLNKMGSIQALLRVLLLEVKSLQEFRTQIESENHSQAYHITQKFKELLSEQFSLHREVTYYAGKLFITPKHLSQTLKEQTGKTASGLINEIICLEAKVLLQDNGLNIIQISEHLNFANPSFFGKFFKRHTGMSPLKYRRTLILKNSDI